MLTSHGATSSPGSAVESSGLASSMAASDAEAEADAEAETGSDGRAGIKMGSIRSRN